MTQIPGRVPRGCRSHINDTAGRSRLGRLKPLLHEPGESIADQPDVLQGDPDDDPPGTGGAAGSEGDSDDDQQTEGVEQTETPQNGEYDQQDMEIRLSHQSATAAQQANDQPDDLNDSSQSGGQQGGQTSQTTSGRGVPVVPLVAGILLLGLLLVALSGGDDQPTEVDSEVTEETERPTQLTTTRTLMKHGRTEQVDPAEQESDEGETEEDAPDIDPDEKADISLDELDVDPDDVEEEAGAASADESDPDDQDDTDEQGTDETASQPAMHDGETWGDQYVSMLALLLGEMRSRPTASREDRRGHRGTAALRRSNLTRPWTSGYSRPASGPMCPPARPSPSARPVSSRWPADRDRRSERPDGWSERPTDRRRPSLRP